MFSTTVMLWSYRVSLDIIYDRRGEIVDALWFCKSGEVEGYANVK
jgi:hypothetical protein